MVVDTTVQPKAVMFPTDAKLLNRARERLVRLAAHVGVELRQSYARVGKRTAFGHLSARHGELAVTDGAFAAHVAVNGQVVWRVRENELGFLVVQQPPVIPILEGVAAEDAVLTQEPQVAWLGDTRVRLRIGDAVFRPAHMTIRL